MSQPAATQRAAAAPHAVLFALLNAAVWVALYLGLTTTALATQGVAAPDLWLLSAWSSAVALGVATLLAGVVAASVAAHRRGRLPRAGTLLGPVAAGFCALLLVLDCKVYDILGVRLDGYFMGAALNQGHFLREAELSLSTWLSIGAAGAALVTLQWGLWRGAAALARRLHPTPRVAWLALGGATLLATLVLAPWRYAKAHAAHDPALSALPLGSWLDDTLHSGGADPGHIVAVHPAAGPLGDHRPTRPHNIAMVLVESLRGDHQTPARMPELHRIAQARGCVTSRSHHSGGHATAWGTFSFLYGLNSYHFLPFHKVAMPSLPLKLLKAQGYELVGVSGSQLKGWDHSDYMLASFDRYKEFTRHRGAQGYKNDEEALAWIERFVKGRKPGSKPFVLFVFLVSPHHNYHYRPDFERHTPVMPEHYNHFLGADKLKKDKTRILNRYHNSVLWTDHLVGRIEALVSATPHADHARETLFAVAGDHGEEFWDHGLMGHGAPRLFDARTRVPLLLCVPPRPGQPKGARAVSLSTHADVWPTLLDALALDPPLDPKTWSDGVSLRTDPPPRDVVVTSVGYPTGGKRLALITPNHKLWLKRTGGFDEVEIERRLTRADAPLADDGTPGDTLQVRRLVTRMRRFLRKKVAEHRQAPAVAHPVDAKLGPHVRLVGANVQRTDPKPGGSLRVAWVFECLSAVPEGWRLFFHLGVAGRGMHRPLDHVPVEGTWPLQRWNPGRFVVDEHEVALPKALRPGDTVLLKVGLWAPGKGRAAVELGSVKLSVNKRSLVAVRVKL